MSVRLDVKKGKILDTAKNREILSNSENKENITKSQAIEKLRHYRVVEDNGVTSNKWHRYININDGKLRGGGFIIKNDPSQPFIAFKNVSLNFTFSAQRDDIILFESKGQDALSDDMKRFVGKFARLSGSNKENYIIIPPPFDTVVSARTKAELMRATGIAKSTLNDALRKKRHQIRKGLVFQLNNNELDILRTDLQNVRPGSADMDAVLEIINLFFV